MAMLNKKRVDVRSMQGPRFLEYPPNKKRIRNVVWHLDDLDTCNLELIVDQ